MNGRRIFVFCLIVALLALALPGLGMAQDSASLIQGDDVGMVDKNSGHSSLSFLHGVRADSAWSRIVAQRSWVVQPNCGKNYPELRSMEYGSIDFPFL